MPDGTTQASGWCVTHERDAMIAAVALEHRFAVVTRNTQDFEGTGLTLINPWLPIE